MTNRIEARGSGIGEVSEAMIGQRAREIASGDGREAANEADVRTARLELIGARDEVILGEETLAEEDRPDAGVPPVDGGGQVPRLEPEDESNYPAEEVDEGVSEADHDTRRRSSPRE